MKLIKYRITKYNPLFRNEFGHYLKDEWTSYSDIGTLYDGTVFSMDEYLSTELKYISCILRIFDDKKVNCLFVKELEKYFKLYEIEHDLKKKNLCLTQDEKELFQALKEDQSIERNKIEIIVKLLLRECTWCKLVNITKDLIIKTGYEYYLFIECEPLDSGLVNEIEADGLYVEIIND